MTMAAGDNNSKRFLSVPEEEIAQFCEQIKSDHYLSHSMKSGIGFIYEGMTEDERNIVEQLYKEGIIQVLIVTYKLSWELSFNALTIVILDNQRYDGQEKRYIDYTIPDMLQMMGRASNRGIDTKHASKCLVFCHAPKKDFYKKFLFEPYPVESHLNYFIANHLNTEVVAKTI